ncbi:cold-shock protein [Alloscardovia macacae]|uniref:Cold-shock protein n=1 Tax=Alloscardovia macacae TaxID=1160091 RepID=A0A1Y2T3J3_9BIFI|nr:cold shock domain-containing protein [Alloscardovia macacae]OTA27012.1 cold-shock protein [Alloscardovia macacae]OTA30000.1 cold-shock protein [Alloscardovia macacae]
MPSGKVVWVDAQNKYAFISSDEGERVYMSMSALSEGAKSVRKGTRVEFSRIETARGAQARDVKLLTPAPSFVKATRPHPEDMAAIVEDVIKLLDTAGNDLRHGHYPRSRDARKLVQVLRAVADNFDVQD